MALFYFVFDEVTHSCCDSLVSVFFIPGFIWRRTLTLYSLYHRRGGALPDGTTVVGEGLVFGRPLRLNDSGVYECMVTNSVGVGRSEYVMSVAGTFPELKLVNVLLCCFGFLEEIERAKTQNDNTF